MSFVVCKVVCLFGLIFGILYFRDGFVLSFVHGHSRAAAKRAQREGFLSLVVTCSDEDGHGHPTYSGNRSFKELPISC